MADFNTLSLLIQRLTKAEKRYISLFGDLHGGDKVYLSLYKLMEPGRLEPAELAVHLARQHPEAVFETARKHLYRMLMKALRSFEADRSVEHQLMQRIQNARILFDKGLIDGCFAELTTGKELALRYEKFTYFLILARQELQYLTRLEFPDTDETELIEKQTRISDILQQELAINRHSSLYEILLHRYLLAGTTRSARQSSQLNDLLLEEYQLMNNVPYHTVESKRLHLQFQSTYFMMTGDPAESLRLFYQLHALFQETPRLLADAPIYYLYLMNGILTDLRAIKQYDAMPFFITSLAAFTPTSDSLKGFVAQLIYQHQLARLIDLGQFAEGLRVLTTHTQQARPATSPNAQATGYLLAALTHFGLDQLPAALQQINQGLAIRQVYISHQVYVACRLLKLLLHAELQNDDYLLYEIRSVERKLKAEKKLFQVEKLTISFLKKWIQSNRAAEWLESFRAELVRLAADPYEAHLLTWLDLVSWAEAKRQCISFGQWVTQQQTGYVAPSGERLAQR